MTDFTRRAALVALLLVTCFGAPAALAAPVSVNVRIEGATKTYFEGPVTTDGHDVTTASAGTRTCDGTNNGAHPAPGPTPGSALDDAARLGGFTWNGDWFDSFQDFLLTEIAGEPTTATTYWALYVNYAGASTGPCQTRSKAGDEVLFARAPFSTPPALRLQGPTTATAGRALNVRVVDGATGKGQAGATVNGAPTRSDGVAALRFSTPGVYRLKAERAGAIRSNAVSVCVDRPEAAPCSSGDALAPRLQWALPGRLASERGRSRTFVLSWAGDDGAGSGVAWYGADVRKTGDGAGEDGGPLDWRSLLGRANVGRLHFRGEAGDTYRFRVNAADRAGNRASVETDEVTVPVDDRSRRLWRFSKGWKRARSATAWGRSVIRTGKEGARARLRFRGTQVALIGRERPRGGRLRVTLDGRDRVLRLRGRSGPRTVLWTSRRLQAGSHRLRVRSLGGGRVVLDAVAPLP
jgi:hypothetical protein